MEFFSNTELVQHFGLTRDKLVCVALIAGGDYMEGVVIALEVLAEFPGEGMEPFQDFGQWSRRVKGVGWDEVWHASVGNMTREKLRKLTLLQAFPSKAAVSASISPAVDTSDERFSCAVPDLVSVMDLAMDRFG